MARRLGRRFLRTSTHMFAVSLYSEPEAPLRGLIIGKLVLLWDGKRGDYREVVNTDELLFSKRGTDSE